MNVNVYVIAPGIKPELADVCEKGLEAALDDIRQHWNEEPTGSQLFWFTDEQENLLATMHRHPRIDDWAITQFADGRQELHQCEYLFDEQGCYESTEVRYLPLTALQG